MSGGLIFLGGSGFLGRALIAHFARAGQQTAAVVRSEDAAEKIKRVSPETRILYPDALGAHQYDRLFNLVVDYGRVDASLGRMMEVNLLFPLGLIERIRCDRIINISTCLPDHYSPYAFSKKSLERALTYLADQGTRRCLNVQMHNFYGPGADEGNFVTLLMMKMLRGEPLELSDCANSRDFIFVDDLVECLGRLSEEYDSYSSSSVSVGSGAPVRLKDMVLAIRDLTGATSSIQFGARANNPREPKVLAADTTAVSRSGWRAQTSLREGLARTFASLSSEVASGKIAKGERGYGGSKAVSD